MATICPKCGNEVKEGMRFCAECGSPMQAAQPVMQQAYTQPEQPVMQQTYTQPEQPQMQQAYTQPVQPQIQQAYAQPAQPVMTQTYTQPAQPVMQQTYTQPAQPVMQQTYTQPEQPGTQQFYASQPAQQPYYGQQDSYQQAPQRRAKRSARRDENGYLLAGPESSTLMRTLSYLGILWLVPFFAAKDDRGARYHCNQGLTLFIVSLVFSIIGGIGTAIGGIVGGVIGVIVSLGSIFTFVLMIIGVLNAMKGVCKPLPLIGGIRILN